MSTRSPVAVGEWYHCYTRGVDKRLIFLGSADYDRFLAYLYLSNGTRGIRISNLRDRRLKAVLANTRIERGEPLVEIGAYALMPNHLHLVMREIREGGIATFMQKVFTGYTQYFNNKQDRTGALLSSTYKSKHIHDDRYLKQVVPYVLLNPMELFDPKWKEGGSDIENAEKQLLMYAYSSLQDFYGTKRPEEKIITNGLLDYYDQKPTVSEMLQNAQEYYREHRPTV